MSGYFMSPPSEPAVARLPVQDLLDLSDAQLARFMEEHRRPNGNFELPVDGWDELSPTQRSHLAERLKYARGLLTRCFLLSLPN